MSWILNRKIEERYSLSSESESDLYCQLWEKIHVLAGVTGREPDSAFSKLFLDICVSIEPSISLEIGAHEATFSQKIKKKLSGVRSIAFEANPYVYELYRKRVSSAVDYRNEAVGASIGTVPLHIPLEIPRKGLMRSLPKANRTSSIYQRKAEATKYETLECRCTTLDVVQEELAWQKSVAWIDVEGATGDVLLGGKKALDRSIVAIYVEVERSAIWANQWTAKDVKDALESAGFFALARDAETLNQHNQIYVKRDLLRKVAPDVSNYIETISSIKK